MMNEEPKKKGFWAALWESMTKTGGCCGGGSDCCCTPDSGSGKDKPAPGNNDTTAAGK